MRDLTQHLTARADDSHAAPCFVPEGIPISRYVTRILVQVRFLAYHRIKPHAPPLVRTPVNSFEFHSCERTPRWVTYRFRLGTHCISRTPSNHRLQRGLPGYLILFDPHAFVPQRQLLSSELPSLFGVPPHIYAFHRYMRNSAHLYSTQAYQYQWHFYS